MSLRLADPQGTDPRRIVVVTAGLSEPSSSRLLADLLGEATRSALVSGGHEVELELIELRPLAHAISDALLTGFPTGDLATTVEAVAAADGMVVVSPVFSASYSGLFKTFFDILETGTLEGTPVLIAATAGSARHALVLDHALRPLFGYLHAVVVPTGVFAASEDWGSGSSGPTGDPTGGPTGVAGELRTRIDRAAAQLASLVASRPARRRNDPFGDVPDFASLLGS